MDEATKIHARVISLVARAALLASAASTTACGDSGGGGDESLSCIPLELQIVEDVFVRRTDGKTLAVEFQGPASVWEEELEVWRKLNDAPGGVWRQYINGDFYVLEPGGLHHSVDGESWEIVGPGLPIHTELGKLLGTSPDGTTWAHDYFGTLQRLSPGASAWTPAFATEAPYIKKAAMAPDGTIWVEVLGGDAVIRGLWRVAADGATIEEVYGCDDEELLFCNGAASVMAFNADGDLFYGDRVRFFQRDVKTGVATERAYLREPTFVFADTIAVDGDTLYMVARDMYMDGSGFLLAFDPGSTRDTEPRVILEAADRNTHIVGHGGQFFLHSPGVCRFDP